MDWADLSSKEFLYERIRHTVARSVCMYVCMHEVFYVILIAKQNIFQIVSEKVMPQELKKINGNNVFI